MNYLLDTHTFLWAAMHPEKLSPHARTILLDVANDIQVSVVTFWEVALKLALGKLELQGITPEELPEVAIRMGFAFLPLASQEAASFYQLPRFQHKDPFDRMLVWQAICQYATLLSKDPDLRQYQSYGLRVTW